MPEGEKKLSPNKLSVLIQTNIDNRKAEPNYSKNELQQSNVKMLEAINEGVKILETSNDRMKTLESHKCAIIGKPTIRRVVDVSYQWWLKAKNDPMIAILAQDGTLYRFSPSDETLQEKDPTKTGHYLRDRP